MTSPAAGAHDTLLTPIPASARHRVSAHLRSELDGEWGFVGLAPDLVRSPDELGALMRERGESFSPMRGAMSIAAALDDLGRLTLDAPPDFDGSDWWIRCTFAGPEVDAVPPDLTPTSTVGVEAVTRVLVFQGLATLVDVWLNGQLLGRADNMFVAWEADVSRLLRARNELVLCARAMGPRLEARLPAPRWRAGPPGSEEWRWHRTTQMGRMPGLGPLVPPVGPWRPVLLERRAWVTVRSLDVSATYLAGLAALSVDALLRIDGPPGTAWLVCGSQRCAATVAPVAGGWRIRAVLESAELAPWWPHTHGEPALHDSALQLVVAGAPIRIALGPIGFRSLSSSKVDSPFAIAVNATRPFLRGSCWVPRDWLRPDLDELQLEAEMRLLRDAGVNCIRLAGCFTYGSSDLLAACDRHGIMVWQDLMFSLLDYPSEDDAFVASCELEVAQQLALLRSSASVLAICGSSEVDQRAVMTGLPLDAARHPLFHDRLARAARRVLPTVPYLPSTPSGGMIPMRSDVGTSHYFGVGAYRRPLDDVRRAAVRFATECLAFAHLPEPESPAWLEPGEGDRGLERSRPRITCGGADRDPEGTRDFYVEHVFGETASRLREESPARYLALARAATAIAVERTLQELRRTGGTCQGALTWLWADPWIGAGWGCVDSAGRPKSAWYAMRHALQPVALALTNEGLNGIDVHAWNDRPDRIEGTLRVRLMRDGRDVVHEGAMPLALDGGQGRTVAVEAVLGRFVDASLAYANGETAHDVVHAVWVRGGSAEATSPRSEASLDGEAIIDEAVLSLTGDARPSSATGLAARVREVDADGRVIVAISSSSLALHVRVGSAAYRASDSYFTLVAGVERLIWMEPLDADGETEIVVEALNDPSRVRLRQPRAGAPHH